MHTRPVLSADPSPTLDTCLLAVSPPFTVLAAVLPPPPNPTYPSLPFPAPVSQSWTCAGASRSSCCPPSVHAKASCHSWPPCSASRLGPHTSHPCTQTYSSCESGCICSCSFLPYAHVCLPCTQLEVSTLCLGRLYRHPQPAQPPFLADLPLTVCLFCRSFVGCCPSAQQMCAGQDVQCRSAPDCRRPHRH